MLLAHFLLLHAVLFYIFIYSKIEMKCVTCMLYLTDPYKSENIYLWHFFTITYLWYSALGTNII